jgi:hypothetical protein
MWPVAINYAKRLRRYSKQRSMLAEEEEIINNAEKSIR